jgi:HlyD family secretion protein
MTMKRIVSLVLVAAVVGGAVWGYLYAQSRGNTPKYRTTRIERGPLTAAVSATGNLNAVTTVQVGSQVSGQIKDLFADFNTLVRKDQLIARIDPETFEAKVNQAKADMDSSRATVLNQQAQVERARADVENAKAAYAEAKANTAKAQVTVVDSRRDLVRKDELFHKDLIAKSDYDASEVTRDSSVALLDAAKAKEQSLAAGIQSMAAQLKVAEAMLKSAEAQVVLKQAALKQAQVDLDHTQIRAPVNGVVVSRAVDVGQTVAASLQAPVLFTIAEDLTKMQVETSVDEADIGRIKLQDQATFTVDAFPAQTFTGTVTQIRKAAQVVQNVVTYTVIIGVDNPGGRLLPGMTANVKMVVAEKPDVVKVANAALRFRPPGDSGPAPGGPGGVGGQRGSGAGAPPSGGRQPAAGSQPGDGATAGGRSPEAIRERLVKSLNLTEEQQRKLDPILNESRRQTQALQGVPDDQRQQRAAKVRETTRAQIREILTADQRVKYDERASVAAAEGRGAEARGGSSGRVYVIDASGKPKAINVVLGISDGAATEIVRGDVTEGQEVITGLGGAGSAQRPGAPTTGGPRLRL